MFRARIDWSALRPQVTIDDRRKRRRRLWLTIGERDCEGTYVCGGSGPIVDVTMSLPRWGIDWSGPLTRPWKEYGYGYGYGWKHPTVWSLPPIRVQRGAIRYWPDDGATT